MEIKILDAITYVETAKKILYIILETPNLVISPYHLKQVEAFIDKALELLHTE